LILADLGRKSETESEVLFAGTHRGAAFDADAHVVRETLLNRQEVVQHHRLLLNSPDVEDKVRGYRSLLHWCHGAAGETPGEVDERAREIASLHFERIVELICVVSRLLIRAQLAARKRDSQTYRQCVEGAMERCCRLPQVGFSTAARTLSFVDPEHFCGLDPPLALRIETQAEGRWEFEWSGLAGTRLSAASPQNRAGFVRWLAHLQTVAWDLNANGVPQASLHAESFRGWRPVDVEFALAAS